MEVKVDNEVILTLRLNIDEVRWLKDISQNYLGGNMDESDESPKDSSIRSAFWGAAAKAIARHEG
jgi:hypothetical protein